MKLSTAIFDIHNEIKDSALTIRLFLFFLAVLIIALTELLGIGILVPFAASIITGENYFTLFNFSLKIDNLFILYIIGIWTLKSFIFILANVYTSLFIQDLKTKLQSVLLNKFLLRTNRSVGSDTGELFTRMTNDIQMITGQILTPLSVAVSEFILICIILIIIFGVFPTGLVILVISMIIGFTINQFTVAKISHFVGTRRKKFESEWAQKLTGALFSRFEALTYRVEALLHSDITNFIRRSNLEAGKFYALNTVTRSLLEISAILGLISAMIIGLSYNLSADSLLFFLVGSIRLLPGAMKIGYAISSIKFASSVVMQVAEILTLNEVEDNINLVSDKKTASLKNLNDSKIELGEIKISEKGITVIVGPSGVGKSTWLSLLAIQLSEKKFNVGLVLQESALLAGDLYSNVQFYRNYITEEAVEKLLTRLQLQGPLSEDSFDVQNLSGGEKRRLMLARATICKPDILLLDEPTAGLDQETQYNIMGYIKEISKHCKVIMISHSKFDSSFADTILEMKGPINEKQ
jgi:ABC-type multidrug transport system fused ATPase/permease subunit